MEFALPKGIRHKCCVGGWIYVNPYGFVICSSHEKEAKKNGKPNDYFIGWFKTWQP